MTKHGTGGQQDLFEAPPPDMQLGTAERAEVVQQLQTLLMEAMATLEHPETGDDQDHA
jgi:hypothetical protein